MTPRPSTPTPYRGWFYRRAPDGAIEQALFDDPETPIAQGWVETPAKVAPPPVTRWPPRKGRITP